MTNLRHQFAFNSTLSNVKCLHYYYIDALLFSTISNSFFFYDFISLSLKLTSQKKRCWFISPCLPRYMKHKEKSRIVHSFSLFKSLLRYYSHQAFIACVERNDCSFQALSFNLLTVFKDVTSAKV